MDRLTNQTSNYSFIGIIQDDLGEKQWNRLDDRIIQRFTSSLEKKCLRYLGTVNWVYCSPIGALIAKVLQPFSLLPDRCVRDSQFEFVIRHNKQQVVKQRRYYLGKDLPFTFSSLFDHTPGAHEEFAGGLGMYLKLAVKNGSLLFRSQGYFLRLGRWRMRIPRWLSVGHFELLHRSIDQRRFQVIIRIAHPLLGVLFYQRGEFVDSRCLGNCPK